MNEPDITITDQVEGSSEQLDPDAMSVLLDERDRQLASAERRIAELEAQIQGRNASQLSEVELMEQLTVIRAGAIARRGHLRHLLLALQENLQRLRYLLDG